LPAYPGPVRVRSSLLAPLEHALFEQAVHDRHHGRVGKPAGKGESFVDLRDRGRVSQVPDVLHDRMLELAQRDAAPPTCWFHLMHEYRSHGKPSRQLPAGSASGQGVEENHILSDTWPSFYY